MRAVSGRTGSGKMLALFEFLMPALDVHSLSNNPTAEWSLHFIVRVLYRA